MAHSRLTGKFIYLNQSQQSVLVSDKNEDINILLRNNVNQVCVADDDEVLDI